MPSAELLLRFQVCLALCGKYLPLETQDPALCIVLNGYTELPLRARMTWQYKASGLSMANTTLGRSRHGCRKWMPRRTASCPSLR